MLPSFGHHSLLPQPLFLETNMENNCIYRILQGWKSTRPLAGHLERDVLAPRSPLSLLQTCCRKLWREAGGEWREAEVRGVEAALNVLPICFCFDCLPLRLLSTFFTVPEKGRAVDVEFRRSLAMGCQVEQWRHLVVS